jgi:hypothetical protein
VHLGEVRSANDAVATNTIQPDGEIGGDLERGLCGQTWPAVFAKAEIIRHIASTTEPEVFDFCSVDTFFKNPYNPAAS